MAERAERRLETARGLVAGLDLASDFQQLSRLLCLDDRSTRYGIEDGRARLFWRVRGRFPVRPLLCGRPFRQFQSRLVAEKRLGDPSRADEILSEVLHDDPACAEAWAMRGRVRQAQSLWHEALSDYARALALRPDWQDVWGWKGETHCQLIDPAAAEAALERALSGPSPDPWWRVWLSTAKALAGDPAGARREFDALKDARPAFLIVRALDRTSLADAERAAALAPGLPWSHIARGHLRYHAGDFAGAVEDFGAVLKADPACFWAYVRRAQARLRGGDAAGARRDWDAAKARHHAWTWALGFLDTAPVCEVYTTGADIFMGARDRRVLDARVAADPGNGWLRALRTMLISDKDEAAREMEAVTAAHPRDAGLGALAAWSAARRDAKAGLRLMDKAFRAARPLDWMHARRGELLRRLGDAGAGLAGQDRTLKRLPVYWKAHLWRAAALLDLGRPREALASVGRYFEQYQTPKESGAYLLRRALRWKLGDRAGALEDLAGAARSDVRVGWDSYHGSEPLRPGRALAEIRTAARDKILRPAALAWEGELYLRAGRFAASRRSLDRALRLDPKRAWAYAWRGELSFRQGKDGAAVRDLDRAIRLDPFYVRPYGVRAVAAARLGRFAEAARDVEGFLSLSWQELGAFAFMCRQERLAGLKTRAAEDLACLLTVEPDNQWARYETFMLRRAAGDRAGALREFRAVSWQGSSAWSFGPEAGRWAAFEPAGLLTGDLSRELERAPSAWTSAWRGAAFLTLGETARAASDLDRAIATDPRCSWAWGWRGALRLMEQRVPEAAADLARGVAGDPDAGWMRALRALAAMRAGDTGKGVAADLDAAARLDPSDAETHLYRAVYHDSRGEQAPARAAVERALELQPELPWALAFRGRLRSEGRDLVGAREDLRRALSRGERGGAEALLRDVESRLAGKVPA